MYELLVLAAGFFWGTTGIFVRHLNAAGLAASEVILVRMSAAAVLLLAYLLLCRRDLLALRGRDAWIFLGNGIISVIFFSWCYFNCIERTSMAVAAVLLYTSPAFVIVFSRIFFGEEITGKKLLSLVMIFAGCVLVTGVLGSELTLSPAGILLGIGAGVGYACFSVFSRLAMNRGYHSLTVTVYTFFVAAAGAVFMADVPKAAGAFGAHPDVIPWALAVGLVTAVIPYSCYTLGMRGLETGKAAMIVAVEPVTAALLGVFVFGEALSVMTIAGIVLVIAGIVVCEIHSK